MRRKAILAAALAAALFASGRALAARKVQGTVGEVSVVDAAALGSVGFRIWSALPGGTTLTVNNNVTSCRGVRCIRGYVTQTNLNPGGYIGNPEATQVYNGDLPDQPFYELADASMNDPAANHIGYYGVSGVTANNAGIGDIFSAGCTGASASNCFGRIDASVAAPPLTGTYASYGGAPNTIRAIGGLNPIPNVRIDSIDQGVANLSWNDPPTYTAAMRPSTTAPAPPSPVLGVRLWKNERIGNCNSPVGSDPDWTPMASFDLGQTSTQVPLNPSADCTFFALTVRLIGPTGLPNQVETFRVGVSSFPAMTECPDFRDCANDFNPCTDDICMDGACQHMVNNANACDDSDLCTLSDHCSAGACVGSPRDCSDTNPCSLDSCNPSTGTCTHGTISGGSCDDGNTCTTGDFCFFGVCIGSGTATCDDGNLCTTDTCQPSSGCVFSSNTLSCDDSNPCTVNDQCAAGACGGTAITVPPEIAHDRFPARTSLAWDAVPGAAPGTVYDVARGRANELPAGSGGNETCRASGLTQTSLSVPEFPPIGKALWYLVRARNTCGLGTWGSWSNGVPRFPSVCP